VKAAFVTGSHQTPMYGDFEDPTATAGHELLTVTATALSPATKIFASGAMRSSPEMYPLVVGIDGVGHTTGGRRVYFSFPPAPWGGCAERVLVRTDSCLDVPDDLDDVTAAALVNPGLSGVAALTARAKLRVGETVLINGATGTAGKLAVQLAKHLGAGKVVATGRDSASLQHVATTGADVTISLLDEPHEVQRALSEQFRDGVDVVIDYLYGERGESVLAAAAGIRGITRPIRYVVVGDNSGAQITLPSIILRSAPVAVMGSGLGSVAPQDFYLASQEVLKVARSANLQIDTTVVPLADVEKMWNADHGRTRIVFTL
jgi:NADPH:quinone reductase-like Zn-dependent oxidoreductase